MMATVAASWRQGSDIQGRNYFYNYITGESTWNAPETWKLKPSEMWVRNKDERENVYYYNMQTGWGKGLPIYHLSTAFSFLIYPLSLIHHKLHHLTPSLLPSSPFPFIQANHVGYHHVVYVVNIRNVFARNVGLVFV